MKRTLSKLLLGAALFLTSCSKSSDSNPEEPSTNQPTVLLTRITNVTPNNRDNGKVEAEFTYTGKQLTRASLYKQAGTSNFEESHLFNYNAQGQLTGATINSGQYGYRKSEVTYNGNNMGTISFTRYDNTVRGHTLTYQNGKLALWRMDVGFGIQVSCEYTYDNNGHNTKRIDTEQSTPARAYTYNYATFDSQGNLPSTLPNWIYFKAYGVGGLGDVIGINNPLTGTEDGSNSTYSYTYNSSGYPTKVTTTVGTRQTVYAYEYTEVK